jgi:hypothetical protein
MSIVQEHITIGNRNFIRSYSDKNVLIHGGSPEGNYEEAIDPAEFNRQYTETDISIYDNVIEDKAEAYDILMGVEA